MVMALPAIQGASLIDLGVLPDVVLARKSRVSLRLVQARLHLRAIGDIAWVTQPIGGKRGVTASARGNPD
jgi:hypothetical protein